MKTVDQLCLYHYQLPLCDSLPLKGTTLTHRQGVILEIRSGERFGYGEAAPLADFSRESVEAAGQQLMNCCPYLLGKESLPDFLFPSVQFALTSAFWMLEQTQWTPAPLQAPLLRGETESILQRLKHWSEPWPGEFKLKIGKQSLKSDIQRIQTVIEQLPENIRIRLDANQRWSLKQALEVGSQLAPKRIAYIEEPTSDSAEFSIFFQETGIPFALDETAQNPNYHYQRLDGMRALIIKPTLVGGLPRCKELISSAQSSGVRTVLSSAFESDVGIHILQQLNGLLAPVEMPGLDTTTAFTSHLFTEPPQPGRRWLFNSDFLLCSYCSEL